MKKRILSLRLLTGVLSSLMVTIPITASAATEGIYTYSVSDGKATITDCDPLVWLPITIPSTINDYPVTSIGFEAFRECEYLTAVTIPDSVTNIGNYAFTLCMSLTDITIPDGVTSIGEGTFTSCMSLTDIIIPDSVTNIGNWAFSNTGLTTVTIPDNVTSIGVRAFADNLLTSVTIGDSVTSIGDDAFYSCPNLTDVYYKGTEEEWNNIVIGLNNEPLTNATIHYIKHTRTTISEDKKTCIVNPVNIETGKTVILSLYDGDRFVEMKKKIYEGEEICFTTTETYTKAKVFVWNDLESLVPVCRAEIVK